MIGNGGAAMKRWWIGLLLLASVVPAWAGRPVTDYRNDRVTIRAAVFDATLSAGWPAEYGLVLDTLSSGVVPVTYTQADPDFSFEFYPPKPPGWEFINPLPPTVSGHSYWEFPENPGSLLEPVLSNYDLLLAPVYQAWQTGPGVQEVLMRWVQGGGLLWLDVDPAVNQQIDVLRLLAEPPPRFAAPTNDLAVKVAAEPGSLLLRGRYALTVDEINLLGVQFPYASSPLGRSGTQGFLPWSTGAAGPGVDGYPGVMRYGGAWRDISALPTRLHEVVTTVNAGGSRPVIAAGRYGRGAVVITACGVADAIGRWQLDYANGTPAAQTELPEWSLPDLKFAYNMIDWWLSPAGQTLDAGYTREPQQAPLAVAAVRLVPGLPVPGNGGAGPAAVWEGVAYFGDREGYLYAMDIAPNEDRNGDGNPDDGVADLSLGADCDLIWSMQLPSGYVVCGAPAVGMVADPTTHRPRPLVAVAARDPSSGQRYLHAVWGDAADPAAEPVSPYYPFPIQLLSRPDLVNGDTACGPVVLNGMIFLATRDSSPNPGLPARDGHILVFDPLHPARRLPDDSVVEWPAVHLELAQAGSALGCYSPISMGLVSVYDEVSPGVPGAWSWSQPAEALVWAGNGLPRTSGSATGRLWMSLPMLRPALPNWNGRWLLDPALGQDDAANQAVQVWLNGVQIPPHVNDDQSQPLNYIRRVVNGQAEIIFTRWSFFRYYDVDAPLPHDDIDYRTGWSMFELKYTDNTGVVRTATLQLSTGLVTPLNMLVEETPLSGPCVVGEAAYVGGKSVNGYPSACFYGGLAAVQMTTLGQAPTKWQLYGMRRPGGAGSNHYYDFPYTPAVAGKLVFAAGNLVFTQALDESGSIDYPSTGSQAVFYALDTGIGDELRLDETGLTPGSPLLGLIDYQAPLGQSADPGRQAPPGQRGAPAYLQLVGGEAIPMRSGTVNNWWVDYNAGMVRMNLQAVGRNYLDISNKALLTYFSGGVLQQNVPVYLPRLVVWQYVFPAGERVVGPPVASGRHVFLVTQENAGGAAGEVRLYAFEQQPSVASVIARDSNHAPVGSLSLGAWAQLAQPVAMTASGSYLVVSLDGAGSGFVVSLGQAGTMTTIADHNRLLAVDSGGRATWSVLSTLAPSPSTSIPTGQVGLPETDTYASWAGQAFSRPSRVRLLGGGRMLVCDTGNNRVVELDQAGRVCWQYPDSDIADPAVRYSDYLSQAQIQELMTPTAEALRLLGPTDVQRYVTVEIVNMGLPEHPHQVRWETTLIADAGHYRLIEVVRPLVDGRYDPTAGGHDAAASYRQTVQVLADELTLFGDTGQATGKLMYTTAARVTAQGPRSTQLLCSVANRALGLVAVDVAYDAQGVVTGSTLPLGVAGYSQVTPRAQVANDFVEVRQADVLPRPDDPTPGRLDPRLVVVDRHGVKVLTAATWCVPIAAAPVGAARSANVVTITTARPHGFQAGDVVVVSGVTAGSSFDGTFTITDTPDRSHLQYQQTGPDDTGGGGLASAPVMEMTRADYQAELTRLRQELATYTPPSSYPPCMSRESDPQRAFEKATAYAAAGADSQFHPVYAQYLASGKLLVVNSFGAPYGGESLTELAGPTKSEVLEYDGRLGADGLPLRPVGQRIFDLSRDTWDHFVVPDPLRATYPLVAGTSAGLKQPLAVERR